MGFSPTLKLIKEQLSKIILAKAIFQFIPTIPYQLAEASGNSFAS
jgi:hypothetical protein